MIERLKMLYRNNEFAYYLCYPLRELYYLFFFYLIPDKLAIDRKFRKKMGYKLDWNNLRTFSEKLQWLKLYDRKPWYSDCVDKLKVRDYVSKKLGTDKYLIPLYAEFDDWRKVKPENMPNESFVIKCNHDNSSHTIVHDKNSLDWKKLRYFYKRRLTGRNFYWNNREWPYKNVNPRIMVEKFLDSKSNEYQLQEYKFHCFGGEIKIVSFYEYGCDGKKRHRFLDKDYFPMDEKYSMNVNLELLPDYKKIAEIDELTGVVRKLAENFEYYIRVDLYYADGQIYIGELTFFDSAGYEKISPESWNLELGESIHLPTDNN